MLSPQTIVAPATPPGEGGIGIVRLSGSQAPLILAKIFFGKTPFFKMRSHHLYRGRLQDCNGQLVDDVLAVIMRAPHSYTGEDVVEIHCHGGSQIMRSVLDLLLDNGAQIAAPGEFTQRAYLNGRLDLAQAEAVVEVIKARSDRACKVALEHLDGHLSQRIYSFSDTLKSSLALLEAHIDFPDDEVGALDHDALIGPIQGLISDIDFLVGSFDMGRVLREGISVLILGRPNVGKSSLMNALLGESRAIVTAVAGTTRDTLEEQLVLAGYPLRLVDAAGVRETDDVIEREGVRRAREKVKDADLILLVVDGSAALTTADFQAFDLCDSDKTLLLINKSDRGRVVQVGELERFGSPVEVSAKYGSGLDSLRQAIVARLSCGVSGDSSECIVITERRQRDALLQSKAAMVSFVVSLGAGVPYECLAFDLRQALDALGLITGETAPDEILDQIFSRFCVGK